MDKTLLIAACLPLLWLVEALLPIREHHYRKLSHAGINVGFGLFNGALGVLLFGIALAHLDQLIESRQLGLLHAIDWAPALEWLLVLLLFDGWQYLWHRLNHRVPLLWRFHAVHHCDAHMDATTALRFHFGEITLSFVARLLVLPLLGMSLEQLLLYELIALPVILLHHSNTHLSPTMNRWLSRLIVTPSIHWVHHSSDPAELNTNYASLLAFWDTLFGTARRRSDTASITLGLGDTVTSDTSRLARQWLMPFGFYAEHRIDGHTADAQTGRDP